MKKKLQLFEKHAFFLRHTVYYVVMWQHVCIVDMLPHHYMVQYMLPDDGGGPKHVGAILMCILMLILKLFQA